MIGWGLADFLAKRTVDIIGDLQTLFWSQAIGVVPLMALFAAQRDIPDFRSLDPLYLVLFGIVSALSYLPVYIAFGKGKVSVLSPIFASYAGLVVIVSAIFFGEAIPTGQWLALAVIFVGIVLISTDPREIGGVLRGRVTHAADGVPEIVAALVVYSGWLILLDRFLSGRPWILFMLLIRATAAVTLFIYARATRVSLRVGRRDLWLSVGLIGLCDVGAFSSVAFGFSHTAHAGVIAVLSATFSLPTLVLARLFLRERLTSVQQLAACSILGGVALVSLR
jgi:drug/metabolite transporter (DMT)-like permease